MWLPIFDFLGGKALKPTCISCIHGMNGDIIRITPTTATTISISVSPSRFLVAWGFLSKDVTVFVCEREIQTATIVKSTNGIVRAASRPCSREHLAVAAATTATIATAARPHLLDGVDG